MNKFYFVGALALSSVSAFGFEILSNGSFENPVPGPGWVTGNPDGSYFSGSVAGWTNTSGSAGVWKPNLGPNTFSSLPDGVNAGFTGDGGSAASLKQTTGHVLAAGETVTFSGYFGSRADLSAYNVLSQGTASIVFGNTTVGSISLTDTGTGSWNFFSYNFGGNLVNAFAGQTVSVVLSSNAGAQMSYDKISVQVSSVPEPASMAALGLGIAGLLSRKRRKSN